MAYTTTPPNNETIANLPGDIRAVTTLVTNHTEATSGAHAASAISYETGTVQAALDTAAGHEANQNNPHNVTAAQAGAVALTDAVTTVTPNKVVMRDSNGKIAGDITGNAANVTGNVAIANGGTGAITAAQAISNLLPTALQGDIIYYNGTTWVRLPAGLAGQFLRCAGTYPEWSYPEPDPRRVYFNGNEWVIWTGGSGDWNCNGMANWIATGTTANSYCKVECGLMYSDIPVVNGFYDSNPVFSMLAARAVGDSSAQKVLRIGTGMGPMNGSDTTKVLGFKFIGNVIYAWNADGGAQTITDISAGITITDQNYYFARMLSGSKIEFFVNGALKATHTTNLPNGSEEDVWSLKLENGTDAANHKWNFSAPSVSFTR